VADRSTIDAVPPECPGGLRGKIRLDITYSGGVLVLSVYYINHYSEQGCSLN